MKFKKKIEIGLRKFSKSFENTWKIFRKVLVNFIKILVKFLIIKEILRNIWKNFLTCLQSGFLILHTAYFLVGG